MNQFQIVLVDYLFEVSSADRRRFAQVQVLEVRNRPQLVSRFARIYAEVEVFACLSFVIDVDVAEVGHLHGLNHTAVNQHDSKAGAVNRKRRRAFGASVDVVMRVLVLVLDLRIADEYQWAVFTLSLKVDACHPFAFDLLGCLQ